MSADYDPRAYWSQRLKQNFNVRGTGHLDYDERYNAWLYRAKARALRQAIAGARPGDPALDLGSGTGWVVAQLLEHGLAVDGCDISELAVARLERGFPTASFFTLALGEDRIERPDACYSVITALDLIYHVVERRRWLDGLAEIARVLRPGGRLIVSDGFGANDSVPAPHVRFRSRETWRQAERLGLVVTEIRPYYRWLSRDRASPGFRRLPDGARGALEFALERLAPRAPHMRCAVLTRTTGSVDGASA